jgi:hypothetical protein
MIEKLTNKLSLLPPYRTVHDIFTSTGYRSLPMARFKFLMLLTAVAASKL